MKLEGKIISKDGASTLEIGGRYQSADLLCLNFARANALELEEIIFDIQDVMEFTSVKIPGYSNPFMVARVSGVCALIIKKEQTKEVQKELKHVPLVSRTGETEEILKVKEAWLQDDDLFSAYMKAIDSRKAKLRGEG